MSRVKSDPELTVAEQELIIRVAKDQERLTVYTEIPSVARALLTREDFETVSHRQEGDDIVAVKGTLPLGVLKIQENARQYGKFSKVVSSHESD